MLTTRYFIVEWQPTIAPRLLASILMMALMVVPCPAFPQDVSVKQEPSENRMQTQLLIPQNLLKLLHAPEVHAELDLTSSQVSSLEELFGKIDAEWFRSRNMPNEAQYQAVQRLEGQALEWLKKTLKPEQVSRVKQLLLRSQGVRMLLNSYVQKELGLTTAQIASLTSAADRSHQAEQKLLLAMRSGGETKELLKKQEEAAAHETQYWTKVLDDSQKAKVTKMLGEEFDTRSLSRVYPMAPELISAADWINSEPLKLADLRGKVVLLHFYAFQCHNCHANFADYIRWHDQYQGQDVVVLGIQTPETPAESDPMKVRQAAEQRGLKFPIMVDLGNKNWDNWANTMWPTVYVIDQQGYLRHWWQGELKWQGAKGDEAIDKLIHQLLADQSAL